ncbi:MAG: gliding motility-associated C-terminal domain-containing protein, partial [Flavobacteriaceae bacterium]
MEVEYTIFNHGAVDLPEQTPIAFYIDSDWAANDATEIIIPPGGQHKQFTTITLPETIPETFDLKVVVNDDGQGNFVIEESDYTNNEDIVIYTFEQFPVTPPLQDMQLCNEGLNRAVFNFSELLDDLQLGNDEEISFFETFDDAQANENRIFDFYSYLNITNPQTIYVRLENQFCFVITNFDISVNDCPPSIPQGFSPNDDQVNDEFEISNLLDIFPDHELHIYSRYGNLIFIGNNETGFWDGISNQGVLKGDLVPVGVYYYILYLNHPDYDPFTGWIYLNR